jgi:hypothetical protein
MIEIVPPPGFVFAPALDNVLSESTNPSTSAFLPAVISIAPAEPVLDASTNEHRCIVNTPVGGVPAMLPTVILIAGLTGGVFNNPLAEIRAANDGVPITSGTDPETTDDRHVSSGGGPVPSIVMSPATEIVILPGAPPATVALDWITEPFAIVKFPGMPCPGDTVNENGCGAVDVNTAPDANTKSSATVTDNPDTFTGALTTHTPAPSTPPNVVQPASTAAPAGTADNPTPTTDNKPATNDAEPATAIERNQERITRLLVWSEDRWCAKREVKREEAVWSSKPAR